MANINTRFPEEVLKTTTADGYGLDAALAIAVLTSEIQKFDPDQARDEAGKWTAGGGGRFSNLGAVPQGRGGGGGGPYRTREQRPLIAHLESAGFKNLTGGNVWHNSSDTEAVKIEEDGRWRLYNPQHISWPGEKGKGLGSLKRNVRIREWMIPKG